MSVETRLNTSNPQHQTLIATLANFVTKHGYTSRELFELLRHAESRLFFALQEMEGDKDIE